MEGYLVIQIHDVPRILDKAPTIDVADIGNDRMTLLDT
jgi:hypothetical protein